MQLSLERGKHVHTVTQSLSQPLCQALEGKTEQEKNVSLQRAYCLVEMTDNFISV